LGQVLALLATAIVAVVFQPLRDVPSRLAKQTRIRGAAHTVRSSVWVRAAGPPCRIRRTRFLPQLAALLREATGAERAEAWLRVGAEIRRVAVDPASTTPPGIPVERELLPVLPDADYTVPVRHGEELLGALAITKRRGDRVTPGESKLLDDLRPDGPGAAQPAAGRGAAGLARANRAGAGTRNAAGSSANPPTTERNSGWSLCLSCWDAHAPRRRDPPQRRATSSPQQKESFVLRSASCGSLPRASIRRSFVTGGLEPALRSLADRSPVPVEMDVSLAGRAPEAARWLLTTSSLRR